MNDLTAGMMPAMLLSVESAIIPGMDVFDSEPYLGLVPRRWLRQFVWIALVVLAFAAPVREWWFEQAEQHVWHEIQPLIDSLLEQTEPAICASV